MELTDKKVFLIAYVPFLVAALLVGFAGVPYFALWVSILPALFIYFVAMTQYISILKPLIEEQLKKGLKR